MLEISLNAVVVARFNYSVGVEVISEQDTQTFAPRVAAHSVHRPIAVSTRLFVQYSISIIDSSITSMRRAKYQQEAKLSLG